MGYDRVIKYFYYYEDGVKVKNVGFVKLELRNGKCDIQIQINGMRFADHVIRKVYAVTAKQEAIVEEMNFIQGRGNLYWTGMEAEKLFGLDITYEQLLGIRIPITAQKEIFCEIRQMQAVNNADEQIYQEEAHEINNVNEQTYQEEARGVNNASEQIDREESQEVNNVNEEIDQEEPREVNNVNEEIDQEEPRKVNNTSEQIDQEEPREVNNASELVYQEESQEINNVNEEIYQNESQEINNVNVQIDQKEPREVNNVNVQIDQEEPKKINNAKERAYHGKSPVMEETKWLQLSSIYPHINPFGDEREYLSIGPSDLVVLTEKYFHLATNSFLLHGYYNYKHLIINRMLKRGTPIYYIGVPGNFFEQEKQVAVLFGFESFECLEEPAKTGDYGYYMIRVEL